jgi:hypothetical protein
VRALVTAALHHAVNDLESPAKVSGQTISKIKT